MRKTDRRIERTHHLLRDALMALIIEKGYDQITVQDIADKANVARTTFYLHFKDKDELLFESMRGFYEELFEAMAQGEPDPNLGLPFTLSRPADYEHVAKYADFYRVMCGERGSMAFFVRVQDFLARMIKEKMLATLLPENQQPLIPMDILAYHCAGSQIALIKWWLDNDMQYSPAEMAEMSKQIWAKGMMWAVGLAQHSSIPNASKHPA